MVAKPKRIIKGKPLRPSAAIIAAQDKAMRLIMEAMRRDIERAMRKAINESNGDASLASQVRIVISSLTKKWDGRFNEFSKNQIYKMMNNTLRQVNSTLRESLVQISPDMSLPRGISAETDAMIRASTIQAASLIKRIPAKYLGEVEQAVMRSIVGGENDVLGVLTEKYEGNYRRARWVFMDQARKAHTSIAKAQMESAGVTKFEWLHSHASAHPRELHEKLSGQVFDLDKPPIIDYKTKERGYPSQLVNCRCMMMPVVELD